MNKALTISGSDSLGVVGVQKDLEFFWKNNVQPFSIIENIMAQTIGGTFKIEVVSKVMIKNQMKVLFETQDFDAIKIGALIGSEEIKLIGKILRKTRGIPNIIVNPQVINGNGEKILSQNEKKALIKEIFPLAYLLILDKENIEEILDIKINSIEDIEEVLKEAKKLGPVNILIRNLKNEKEEVDVLYDGDELTYFIGENLDLKDTYILGEKLSSAITSFVANGYSLKSAIKLGKEFIEKN